MPLAFKIGSRNKQAKKRFPWRLQEGSREYDIAEAKVPGDK